MADRLTVVFDDPELYRKLKMQAAREGVAMKAIIETAVATYLEGAESTAPEPATPRALDWERWDDFQHELEALAEEAGTENASDIKTQLYGYPRRELTEQGWRHVAEEPAEYDAR